MRKSLKVISLALSGILVLGLSACSDSEFTWDEPDQTTLTTPVTEGGIEANPDLPTVKWLGYYDLLKDDADLVAMLEEKYNYTIETEICSSGAAYFETLGKNIASDLSPDIVRYEWLSFPYGMSNNMYTPLDDHIDLTSDLWKDMAGLAEQFKYNGKYYYIPYRAIPNFAINYNKLALEEANLEDPLELYKNNEWTWDKFKELMVSWKAQGDDYIGYIGVSSSFVSTTGTVMIDVTPDGQILNNIDHPNVQRVMEFLEGLYKEDFVGGGYKDPGEAFLDKKLLFLGMAPEWTFSAAGESLSKNNIEAQMAFVPFPRDVNADAYYSAIDTFGYLIPAGAKNVNGALAWINLNRENVTDPEKNATARDEALSTEKSYYPKCSNCGHIFSEDEKSLTHCPECETARRERYKVVFTAEQYDLLQEMKNPASEQFSFVFDDFSGFGASFVNLFTGGSAEEPTLMDSPLHHGASYTQVREALYNTVESYLEPYREKMSQ